MPDPTIWNLHGRQFQVWDYTPSHRTLLLRSPRSSSHESNLDLLFTGVREVRFATVMVLTELRADSVSAGRVPLTRFVLLQGDVSSGEILAERVEVAENANGLFEALTNPGARTAAAAAHLEAEVHEALRAAFPDADIVSESAEMVHDRGALADFALSFAGGRVLVEILWTNERSPKDQVAAVWAKLRRLADTQAPLVGVLGGMRADEVAALLAARIRKDAPEARVEVVAWSPGGRTNLRRAVLHGLVGS